MEDNQTTFWGAYWEICYEIKQFASPKLQKKKKKKQETNKHRHVEGLDGTSKGH